mgnify:CR=1 FL=1
MPGSSVPQSTCLPLRPRDRHASLSCLEKPVRCQQTTGIVTIGLQTCLGNTEVGFGMHYREPPRPLRKAKRRFASLEDQFWIEETRARSAWGVMTSFVAKLLAYLVEFIAREALRRPGTALKSLYRWFTYSIRRAKSLHGFLFSSTRALAMSNPSRNRAA